MSSANDTASLPGAPPASCPRFIISSLPRCGSTTVSVLLNSHPDLRCIIEPFHPQRYRGVFHNLATTTSVDHALSTLWRNWNGIKHVWDVNGWPFLCKPELNDHVLTASGAHVILLVRRNWLQRAVSHLICRYTNYWIGSRQVFRERLRDISLPSLNSLALSAMIKADQFAIDRCQLQLRARGVPFCIVYYEDLFRQDVTVNQQTAQINTIVAFLGATPISTFELSNKASKYADPLSNRWATPEIYRRIPNSLTINSELGSQYNGWLFDVEADGMHVGLSH